MEVEQEQEEQEAPEVSVRGEKEPGVQEGRCGRARE